LGHFDFSIRSSKVLGRKGCQGSKNEDVEKMKKISPGILPIYNCAKFQHDCAVFEFSRVTQIFRAKRVPGPKMQDLKKKEKTIAGITE